MGEARPCPWVGCRHHLLLTVAGNGGLRINRPSPGRRRTLTPGSADDLVALWIDDAVEALSVMGDTCSEWLIADQAIYGTRRTSKQRFRQSVRKRVDKIARLLAR